MIDLYRRLADRIRSELDDLDRDVRRAFKSWEAAKTIAEPDAYIDSVALNLHGFYSGVERLFELIAAQVDERTPESGTWHRDLLGQMAQVLPDVRPAVIRAETAAALDEFRKFRHLVRNIYTAHLDPERMENLLTQLPTVWTHLQAQLAEFADFLEAMSHADEGE